MGWWLAAIIALDFTGLAAIFVVLRRRIDRARSPEAGLEDVRQEIGRIIVELNRVTDRSVALLEDKAASLSELLAAADKKMSLLKREIERHEVGSRLYDRLAASPRGAGRPPVAGPGDDGEAPAAPERSSVAAQRPRADAGRTRADAERPPDARQEVLRLHRAGFSPQIIASRVGVPLGEVELVISLGQRRGEG